MVYVLVYAFYDDVDILGVFTTRALAERAKKAAKGSYLTILEAELDKVYDGLF